MSSEAATADALADASPGPGAEQAPAESRAQAAWRRIDRWLEAVGERFNPILVKETRQALKSQQFVLWFLLLLAACWIITIGGVAWLGPGVHYSASGGVMFLAYFLVLSLAVIVVVPFAAYRSLAAEQEDNTRDVLMVSALTPRQLIDGKMGSAALQVAVYLSALAPCLAFTYLLRGIDLLTVVLLPTAVVLLSLGLSMLGLLLASSTRQRYAQVLTSVSFVALLLLMYYLSLALAYEAVQQGSQVYREAEFWVGFSLVATFSTCAVLLAYFSAAALNTFTSANRSTAIRRVLLLTQACYVAWVAAFWRLEDFDFRAILYTAAFGWVFWALAGALLTSEQPILSERVRRDLPSSTLGRVLTTWFNPGPGSGYLFVASNVATLLVLQLLGWWLSESGGTARSPGVALPALLLGPAYLLTYLGVGRLIITGLRKLAPLSMLGCFLIHFLLLLAGAGFTELIRASFSRYGRLPFTWYDVTNPVRTLIGMMESNLNEAEMILLLMLVLGAMLCVLLVNLLLTAREIQQTRAPLPQRVIEDNRETSAEAPRVTNPWGDVSTPQA